MLGLAFVDNQEHEQPSLSSPRLVRILKVNSWMKTYATSKNLSEAYFLFQLFF